MRLVYEGIGVAGAGAVVYGCHLVWHPLAFLIGGALAILYAGAAVKGPVK